MTEKRAGNGTRSRSFTGCRTCRGRHLKCDEARPICSTCKRLGLSCEGYGARLFWIPDRLSPGSGNKQNQHGTSYRYPLFTEEARSSMSLEIVESIDRRNAEEVVLELDAKSISDSQGHVVGPFGVFKAYSPSSSPSSSSHPVSNEEPISSARPKRDAVVTAASEIEDIVEASSNIGPSQPTLNSGMILNDDTYLGMEQHNWMDSDARNFDSLLPMDMTAWQVMFPPEISSAPFDFSHDVMEFDQVGDGLSQIQEVQNQPDDSRLSPSRQLSSSTNRPSAGKFYENMPTHADELLRYYKEHILNSSSWSNGKRTSLWHLLILPCALETFAELTIFKTASYSRFSILHSLLSISAFQLSKAHKADGNARKWLDIAMKYQETGKTHLGKALVHEVGPGGHERYHEILMAILTMAMASSFHSSNAVKVFLLDAERFIRLHGLNNPKSYKIRVLHHVYTHMRLMAESICIPVDLSKDSQLTTYKLQNSVELRKFRIHDDQPSQSFDLWQEKPSEIGYNDIHLEVAGHFPATLFPEIFGIPESLMTLLSRAISLANETGRLDAMAEADSQASTALSRHAKILEQNIWSWSGAIGPGRPKSLVTKESSFVDHPHTRSMVLAMHQALIVYFYRRVYKTSAMLLQSYIQTTLEYLEPCLEGILDGQDFAASVAWSGFTAACEAATPELQERGIKCLEAIDNRGILCGLEKPVEHARKLWARRELSRDWSLSSADILERFA